ARRTRSVARIFSFSRSNFRWSAPPERIKSSVLSGGEFPSKASNATITSFFSARPSSGLFGALLRSPPPERRVHSTEVRRDGFSSPEREAHPWRPRGPRARRRERDGEARLQKAPRIARCAWSWRDDGDVQDLASRLPRDA